MEHGNFSHWNQGLKMLFSGAEAVWIKSVVVPKIGHFAGLFGVKSTRMRTKPEKTRKNLWKPKNSD
jgi:hypothetical protein